VIGTCLPKRALALGHPCPVSNLFETGGRELLARLASCALAIAHSVPGRLPTGRLADAVPGVLEEASDPASARTLLEPVDACALFPRRANLGLARCRVGGGVEVAFLGALIVGPWLP
jgi:hypothetical protein